MKRNTRPVLRPGVQLAATLPLWLLAFLLSLVIGGRSLTLYYEMPPGALSHACALSPEGVARMTGSALSPDGSELAVTLEAVGRGSAVFTLTWDAQQRDPFVDYALESELKTLPFGILLDSVTGNFSGWERFTACLYGFFFTAALIFGFAARRESRRVFFSYRATGELGAAIFFLVLSFLHADLLAAFMRGENPGTVWSLLVSTIATAQIFMRRTAFAVVGFSLVMTVSNLMLMRHEGARPSNMLGFAVSLVMVGGAAFGIWMSRSMLRFPMRNAILNVYAGLFVYFECLLTATVIRALQAGRHEPAYDKDYVLILGCRIRPDGTLYPLIRGRVDRAVDFVNAQKRATGKQAILIPSGGRGGDEPISEGEAMARYMRERGVPGEYILPETNSATTRENLLFSRRLTERAETPVRAAFSTSSYHVYRSGILAAEQGWDIDGMGSRTRWYFWPNAFLREFVGLMAASRRQQLLACALIAAVSVSVTMLVM